MKPLVSILKVTDIKEALKASLSHIGGLESIVPQGSTVMIKPNFTCALPPETGAASDPEIARLLAREALQVGASKVLLAEGMGSGENRLDEVKGLEEIGNMKNVEVIDLNDESTQTVMVPDPLIVNQFDVPRVVLDSDVFINLAKLKVHPQAKLSLAMKNLLGALPGRSRNDPDEAKKQKYLTPVIPGVGKKIFHDLARDHGPEAMQDAIVDLNKVIPSHLTVIDGIYGMEGQGSPTKGKPVRMDLLLSGIDIVAIEAVAAAIIGFDPDQVPYLKPAVERGLGTTYHLTEIDMKGERIDDVMRPFERASLESLWTDTCEVEETE